MTAARKELSPKKLPPVKGLGLGLGQAQRPQRPGPLPDGAAGQGKGLGGGDAGESLWRGLHLLNSHNLRCRVSDGAVA